MVHNAYFIDSNIFLRYLTQDDSTLSPKAMAIFEKIAHKKLNGYITTLVLHEVIYVLQFVYNVKKALIIKNVKKLINLKNLFIMDINKEDLLEALTVYGNKNIDFPDCVYAYIAKSKDIGILSFDRDFRKFKVSVVDKV